MASPVIERGKMPNLQRAAQFRPDTQSVSIIEIPVPTPQPHELLVKTASASLCHSDLMLFEANEAGIKMNMAAAVKPWTMGHEACGTILSLGTDAQQRSGFQLGDNVVWLPTINACLECEACGITPVACEKGASVIQGFTSDGSFQEYVAVDWRNAVKLPSQLGLASAAPLSCAGVTSWSSVIDTIAAMKRNGKESETWVGVVGCGGLGHLGIQYLKKLGYRVIGVDTSDDALDEARKVGADEVFNPTTDPEYINKIRTITGKGCHAAINYTNSQAAYASMPQLLKFGGVLNVTGIPQKPLQFSAFEVCMNRFKIVGSNNGTTERLRECVEFSAKHSINPHVMQYKLDDFPEMIKIMQENRHKGRLAVVFG